MIEGKAEKKEYFKDNYAKIDLTKKVLSDLKDYEKNNKIHPEIQKSTLKDIIAEVWYDVPIVIDKHEVIVAWHCRKEALTLLWVIYVDVIVKDKLSEKQIREYRLLDNKIAELAEDHIENIKLELEELDIPRLNELYDFEVETISPDKEAIEDDVPEVQENIIVEKWDIFQLWEHRLMCGSAVDMDDVSKLMWDKKADCVVTDPPYNTWMKWKWDEKAWLSHMFDDSFTEEEWIVFKKDFFNTYYAVTKWDCAFYVFIDWRRVNDLREEMEKIMDVKNIIVWDKKVHWLGSDYKSTYELCIVWKKWKPDIQNRYWLDYQDIWRVQREMWRNKLHATVKPIELLEKPIKHASKQDDIVLDLFGWSGSTLIACEKLKRVCYMTELSPKYIQTILKRYYDYTWWEKEIKCLNRELNLDTILD